MAKEALPGRSYEITIPHLHEGTLYPIVDFGRISLGKLSDLENEYFDSFGNRDFAYVNPKFRYMLLADGAGRHNHARFASRTAVRNFAAMLNNTHKAYADDQPSREAISYAFDAGSDATILAYQYYVDQKQLDKTSRFRPTTVLSTLVGAQFVTEDEDEYIEGFCIGDSRAYVVCDGQLVYKSTPQNYIESKRVAGTLSTTQSESLHYLDTEIKPESRGYWIVTRNTGTIFELTASAENDETRKALLEATKDRLTVHGNAVHAQAYLNKDHYLHEAIADPRYCNFAMGTDTATMLNRFSIPVFGKSVVVALVSDGVRPMPDGLLLRRLIDVGSGVLTAQEGSQAIAYGAHNMADWDEFDDISVTILKGTRSQ